MKLVIFGLSVSSCWGNGHGTLWRGLCASLGRQGHTIVFFERDTPYYAQHRDLTALPGGGELILYRDWQEIQTLAKAHLSDCDAGMVTSYCPDGIAASELVLDSRAPLRVFYDLDTPVTLQRLQDGLEVDYIGARGLRDFDLALSYTGGPALEMMKNYLGARHVEPLYGSVDPSVHRPAPPVERYRASLSWLGTYGPDRDAALRDLFSEPARRLPDRRFVIAGSKYDHSFPWQPNMFYVNHVPPAEHPAFYCSASLNLNVTRDAMAAMGYCPSGRLFEATACGAAVMSDYWNGFDLFFEPGREILIARNTEEAMAALDLSQSELEGIARAGRDRTLACHTADIRARELETILSRALHRNAAAEVA